MTRKYLPNIHHDEESLSDKQLYSREMAPLHESTYSNSKGKFITFESIKSRAHLDSEDSFGIVSHELQFASARHYHDFIELVYTPEGGLLNSIDGDSLLMAPGSLCFINIGTSHIVMPISEEDRHKTIYNILIDPKLFNYLHPIFRYRDELGLNLLQETPFFYFSPEILQNNIRQIIHHLIASYQKADFHLDFEGLGQLLTLFHKLNTEVLNKKESIDQLTQDCLKIIRNNPREATLSYLSEQVCYSQGYLSRHIREQTGQTVSQWIALSKLNFAQILLEETQDSIAEIVEQIGYQSESHFFRAFKAQFKMTPRQYRKQLNILNKV